MSLLKEKLQKELGKLDAYVVLVLVDARNYHTMSIQLLKYLTLEKKIPGVYVTVNRPYGTMKKMLLQEGIEPSTMVFVDAITKITGGTLEQSDQCVYLEGPENLTDFGIAITEAMSAFNDVDRFLFFDSLNTLLIYNDADAVAKFVHFLAAKIRQWNIKGIILSVEKKAKDNLVAQVSQFCDKIIDLTRL